MSTQQELTLAETPHGRVKLHFLTFLRDHKLKWHLNGIKRELNGCFKELKSITFLA